MGKSTWICLAIVACSASFRVNAFAPAPLSQVGRLSHSSPQPAKTTQSLPFSALYSSTAGDGSSSPSSDAPVTPLQPGGEMVKKSTSIVEYVPPEITDFDFATILENLEAVKDNIFSGGEVGTRGEVYFAIQFSILICILIGTVPVVGKLLFGILGPSLLLGGIAVSLLAATRLGKALSPWPVPTDNASLLTDGFFGQVRHPIYAGLLAACLGLSLVTESVTRLILTALLYYVLDLKTNFEEAALLERFGVDYEDYQQKVKGKLFPSAVLDVLPWRKEPSSSDSAE